MQCNKNNKSFNLILRNLDRTSIVWALDFTGMTLEKKTNKSNVIFFNLTIIDLYIYEEEAYLYNLKKPNSFHSYCRWIVIVFNR